MEMSQSWVKLLTWLNPGSWCTFVIKTLTPSSLAKLSVAIYLWQWQDYLYIKVCIFDKTCWMPSWPFGWYTNTINLLIHVSCEESNISCNLIIGCSGGFIQLMDVTTSVSIIALIGASTMKGDFIYLIWRRSPLEFISSSILIIG